MVHTGGPGNFVSCFNFCFEVFPLIDRNFEIEQIFRFVNSKLTPTSILAALPGAPAPGKARRPQGIFYMTRRAFLALRVIPVQGKSWSSVVANLLGARWSKKLVFRRFLETQSVDFSSSAKINYFRSRRVRWFIREVQETLFRASIFALKSFP